MAELRMQNPVLIYGDYRLLDPENPNIYAYTRTLNNQGMLVLLNFSDIKASISLAENHSIDKCLINNYPDYHIEEKTISLLPYQALIFSTNSVK